MRVYEAIVPEQGYEGARLDAYLAAEPYVVEHVWETIEVERLNVVIGK